MLGGEGLCGEDARTGVDSPVQVEDLGGHLGERAVGTGLGLVAHEDVEMAECPGPVDERCGAGGRGQVDRRMAHARSGRQMPADAGYDLVDVVGAPGLGGVVGRIVLKEHARTSAGQPARDRVAYPPPAADSGDDGDAAVQPSAHAPSPSIGPAGIPAYRRGIASAGVSSACLHAHAVEPQGPAKSRRNEEGRHSPPLLWLLTSIQPHVVTTGDAVP